MSSFAFAPCMVAAIEDGRWVLGIGDPTPMGWATVAAYLLASATCLLWARPPGPGRSLPIVVATLMAMLAINKQLDLQSLFTEAARDLVKSLGLHEDRRELQAIFIGAVVVAMASALGGLAWTQRRRWREVGLALLGLVLLSGFVLVRSASFHNVDHGLGEALGGVKFNWILELGGIGMVFGGAIIGWLSRRPKSSRVELDVARQPRSAEPRLEPPATASKSATSPKRATPLGGFVVRPIQISTGPRGQPRSADRPESPSGLAV